MTYTVTEKLEEFEAAKKAMGNNILLNAFDVTRRTLVITDAYIDAEEKQARGEGEGKDGGAGDGPWGQVGQHGP